MTNGLLRVDFCVKYLSLYFAPFYGSEKFDQISDIFRSLLSLGKSEKNCGRKVLNFLINILTYLVSEL